MHKKLFQKADGEMVTPEEQDAAKQTLTELQMANAKEAQRYHHKRHMETLDRARAYTTSDIVWQLQQADLLLPGFRKKLDVDIRSNDYLNAVVAMCYLAPDEGYPELKRLFDLTDSPAISKVKAAALGRFTFLEVRLRHTPETPFYDLLLDRLLRMDSGAGHSHLLEFIGKERVSLALRELRSNHPKRLTVWMAQWVGNHERTPDNLQWILSQTSALEEKLPSWMDFISLLRPFVKNDATKAAAMSSINDRIFNAQADEEAAALLISAWKYPERLVVSKEAVDSVLKRWQNGVDTQNAPPVELVVWAAENGMTFPDGRGLLREDDVSIRNKALYALGERYRGTNTQTVLEAIRPLIDVQGVQSAALIAYAKIAPGAVELEPYHSTKHVDLHWALRDLRREQVFTYFIDAAVIDRVPLATEIDQIKLSNYGEWSSFTALKWLEEQGAVLFFDLESFDSSGDYESKLKEIASISRGRFEPKQVYQLPYHWWEIDDPSFEDRWTVGFYTDGRRYTTKIEHAGDWFRLDELLQLVNCALENQGISERYLSVDGGGQNGLIFFGQPKKLAVMCERLGYQILSTAAGVARGQAFEENVLRDFTNP